MWLDEPDVDYVQCTTSKAIIRGFAALSVVLSGCWFVPPEEAARTPKQPQAALRSAVVRPLLNVHVQRAGVVSVEADYLPRVVCCENGAAPSEALKAQAVMARTYVYFRYHDEKLGTADRPLAGTAADQAYYCSNEVTDACRAAVRVTADQIMSFPASDEDAVETGPDTFANVGFFVDGPKPACVAQHACNCPKPEPAISMTVAEHPVPCECFDFAASGRASPKYVTFNWQASGRKVQASVIGNPLHGSNRGCASQNIESCLAYAGWRYHDILRFFYGQDTELRTASAGTPIAPEAEDTSRLGTPADDPPPGCAAQLVTRVRKSKKARIAIPIALVTVVALVLVLRRRRRM